MKQILVLALTLLAFNSLANSSYYPTDYKQAFGKNSYKNDALKEKLFKLLAMKHVYRKGHDDILVNHCGEVQGKGNCYGHRDLGYKGARKVLFGKLHLEEGSEGYYVKDVYCRKTITNRQSPVGPNIIPNSNVINCEHTWPQSKFSTRFSKNLQKSDLNHLYPTDSRANSVRGNHEFDDVNGEEVRDCDGSYVGGARHNFEPPTEHKGNVARAIFYFSVRYQMPVSAQQEAALRRWHIEDPVDAEEKERNEWIHKIQGNRNPFIDYPHLVSKITNF
ncbi:MAG: nuclease [Oligoflexia bacterium]|nr:nuclease [Oligoflexia bacterium]